MLDPPPNKDYVHLMRTITLAIVLCFAFQALGLGELQHSGEGHTAAACEQSHSGAPDSGEHGDCHWHCGNCSHPAAPLTFVGTKVLVPLNRAFGSMSFGFVPLAPSANIFHPPA